MSNACCVLATRASPSEFRSDRQPKGLATTATAMNTFVRVRSNDVVGNALQKRRDSVAMFGATLTTLLKTVVRQRCCADSVSQNRFGAFAKKKRCFVHCS